MGDSQARARTLSLVLRAGADAGILLDSADLAALARTADRVALDLATLEHDLTMREAA